MLLASGEDPSCTPKSRKDGSVVGGSYHSHPPTPQSTVPSPGAASLNSMHEEYGDVNSPSWPRTPASPVSVPYVLCLNQYIASHNTSTSIEVM
jgi:AT-rich interactive domain-containing protein 1